MSHNTISRTFLKPGLAALGAVLGLASLTGAAQDDAGLDRQLRELNIMENIFEAAMEVQGDDGRFTIRRVGRSDSLYLAGQGMVFSFRVLQNRPVMAQGAVFGQEWARSMEEAMERTRESLERVRASFPDSDFDFDFDFDFDNENYNVREFYVRGGQAAPQQPQAPQVFFMGSGGPEREAAREMEEAMRDTQEQIRDMQREMRQLERQIRNAEAENEAAIEAEITAIESRVEREMMQLDTQRQAYETFLGDLDSARREQQEAMVAEASDRLISTLCDYGGTLRSLGDNEHVTLILEDVIDDSDQVYVFRFADVSDCRSADSLKQNAVSYVLRGN